MAAIIRSTEANAQQQDGLMLLGDGASGAPFDARGDKRIA